MHELDADRAAIGLAHDLDDLPEGRGLVAENVVNKNRTVQIGIGKAVGLGVELGMGLPRLQVERVELRFEMAAHAIGRGSACAHACKSLWPRRAHRLDTE